MANLQQHYYGTANDTPVELAPRTSKAAMANDAGTPLAPVSAGPVWPATGQRIPSVTGEKI